MSTNAENIQKIADQLSNLTILEAAELAKTLEEKWGVSAAAVAAPAAVDQSSAGGTAGGAEEKSEYTVIFVSAGAKKIEAIKEVRSITGLGLKEAKELVESGSKAVKEGISKEEAEKIKGQLEKVGAKVEIK